MIPARLRTLSFLLLALLQCLALDLRAQTSTAADLPGPDGLVYPDWRYAGIAGGIPTNLPVRYTITASAGPDIATELEAGAATAAAAGGGVVAIPAGTFVLSRPVMIRQSNVVIRGASQAGTVLNFTFQAPVNDVGFYQHPAGATTLYNNSFLQAHADPNGLNRIAIYGRKTDGTLALCAERVKALGTWGATFSVGATGSTIRNQVGTGSHDVVAQAEYDDGRVLTKTATYNFVNSSDANATPQPGMLGAINFCGVGTNTGNILLTADGVRGQNTVQVAAGHGIIAGDLVELTCPRTPTWDTQTGNACVTTNMFRMCQMKVASTTATSLTFTQPLRIDYPLQDGTDVTGVYVRRVAPMTRCGVESLTLQQLNNVWTCGLIFSWAYECWIKDAKIIKPGRNPFMFSPGKFCEVRDSICDNAWYKGEGGTAYCSLERAYDCIMDNMTTYELRHAPLVQWSASGNVIRNGTFYDSDAQWHAGWTNENLFENCTVLSNRGNGGYGFGLWGSPPEDTLHGPQGPRNVVYNCDVTSPLDGAWLGGSNKGWLFLHNRIAADTGSGLYVKTNSPDHVISGNSFLLRNPTSGVEIATADCTGIKVTSNQISGLLPSVDLIGGLGTAAANTGNTLTDALSAVAFTNNGFESNLTGWSNAGDGGMTAVNTAAARTGTKGIRVTDTSTTAGSSLLSPAFAVTAGKVYAARAACRSISGANGTGLYLNFYNSSGTQLRSTPDSVGGETYWHLIQHIETAPAGATTARIYIHSYSADTQTVDFDDFAFGELSLDLPNPGFEYQLEAWDTTGDNAMSSAVAAAAHSGSYGLRVTDASATLGSSCASRKAACTPGVTYQTRFWSRVNSGSGAGVALQFFDSGGALISPSTSTDLSVTTDWSENLLRAVAPANAATVRVQIRSDTASIVTADIDDLTLIRLPARPTPTTASMFDWQRNPTFPFANAGYESALTGWIATSDGGMSAASSAAARTGTTGLRVTDASTTAGSSLRSPSFGVAEGYNYQVDFNARIVSGSGIGVYLYFLDQAGTVIKSTDLKSVPGNATTWTPLSLQARAPTGAVSAYIWVHSFIASVVTADFDDFSFKVVWDPLLSNNAQLSNLSLSAGSLSPVFGSNTLAYTATVSNLVRSITVTPVLADTTALVRVNGIIVETNTASSAIPLSVGSNIITVAVTAQDGTLVTYTITVTRNVNFPPVANTATRSTPQATPVDIDLSTLVSDIETPLASLKLQLGSATNGTVTMLADGRTARFTPTGGYTGPASFAYTVIDTTPDPRTLLNYTFQSNDVTDSSGQGRDATLNIQGTGAATFVASSPFADYTQSLALTENGTAGAVRLDRSLTTAELDLKNADWTLAGWFKRSAATNMDIIAHLGSSGGFGSSSLILAFTGTSSTLNLSNYNSANTQDVSISKANVTTAAWHHFAIVRAGTTVSLYVDGTVAGSDSAFTFDFDNTNPLKWAGAANTSVPDRWLNGSLADLAVFNTALPPADITKLNTIPVQWLGGQTSTATVSISVLTPYETWRQTNFGSTSNTGDFTDLADKDKDGLPNLVEYACATNPNTNNTLPYSASRNGSVLDFIYTKNKSATDVTCTVEWSDDLVTWSTTGVSAPSVLSDNGITQQIKVTVPAGAGVTKRFVHLKVTRP